MPTPRDYDDDPARYRLGMRISTAFTSAGIDLPTRIVELLIAHGCSVVLDVGCGDGVLAAAAHGTSLRVLGVDAAAPMVRAAREQGPVVRAEVSALPVRASTVDAVVAVNVLDHLAEPRAGLREARRVLAPCGVFVAGTISRRDSPELAAIWAPTPTAFDTENAPALVGEIIGPVTVEAWDAALVQLPDRDALRDYLVARFVAADDARQRADALAARVGWPLSITKRGALVVARHQARIPSTTRVIRET